MPYVMFLACSLIWSASFILMKKAALGFTPWSVGAGRCVWGAAVLGFICWRTMRLAESRLAESRPGESGRGTTGPALPRGTANKYSEWKYMALVVILGCAWPYAIQPLIVSRQGSAFMALIVSFVPLATIAVSVPMLGAWPTRQQFIGVGGALFCLGLLLADGFQRHVPPLDFALAVTVPICYAVANTIIRGKLREVPSTILTFHMLAWSGVLLLPMSFVFPAPVATDEVWWTAAGALAILGVLGTALATYWFNKLVRDHGPLFAGMTTNLVPIGALLWGWADQETVTPIQRVALLGIVAMVVLVQYRAAAREPAAEGREQIASSGIERANIE